jgi:hypothetical protein
MHAADMVRPRLGFLLQEEYIYIYIYIYISKMDPESLLFEFAWLEIG